jgi:hypothetical protein
VPRTRSVDASMSANNNENKEEVVSILRWWRVAFVPNKTLPVRPWEWRTMTQRGRLMFRCSEPWMINHWHSADIQYSIDQKVFSRRGRKKAIRTNSNSKSRQQHFLGWLIWLILRKLPRQQQLLLLLLRMTVESIHPSLPRTLVGRRINLNSSPCLSHFYRESDWRQGWRFVGNYSRPTTILALTSFHLLMRLKSSIACNAQDVPAAWKADVGYYHEHKDGTGI